jgi:uncharacterized protein YecE (DUF72 family)
MARRGALHIGTSGWHYKHWVGPFYPEGTRPSAMLDTYAGKFAAVEINNSFYRLLSPKFCIYDIAGRRSPEVVTSDFVYLRLHGPGERAYEGSYSGQRLCALADKIGGWRKGGRDCFVFFDNDAEGHAPRDALRLPKRLERD